MEPEVTILVTLGFKRGPQSTANCNDLCRRFKGGEEIHLPPTSLLEKVSEGTEQPMLDDSLTSDPLQVTLVE